MSSSFPGGGNDDVTVRVQLDVAGVAAGARKAQDSIKGVETEAQRLGTALKTPRFDSTAIEASARQAERAIKGVEDEARQMDRALDAATEGGDRGAGRLSAAMGELGTAAESASAFLTDAALASEESAQIQRQLEQAIANTGDAYSLYADRIDEAGARAVQLGIDDEKAAQAIQALTEITGSAGIALDQLGLVEDLAAAKGIDLVTAAELIGKVMSGNVGILQRYGIVVDKGVTSEQALAQIQQQVAGQAENHATTIDRLTVQYGNLQESVGATLGQFAPLVGILPGLSVGFSAISGTLGALAPKLTAAGVGAAALDVALGPVGLVAATLAAGVAIYELTKGSDDYAKAAKEADEAARGLASTLKDLAAAGSPLAIIGETDRATLSAAIAQMGDLKTAEDALAAARERLHDAEQMPGETDRERAIRQAAIDQIHQQITATEENIRAQRDAARAMEAIDAILTDTGTGADLAQEAMAALFAEFAKTGDVVDLIEGLVDLEDNLGAFDQQANDAAAAMRQMAIDAAGTADAFDVLGKAVDELTLGLEDTAKGQQLLADLQLIATEGTREQREEIRRLWEEAQTSEEAFNLFSDAVERNADVLRDQERAAKETADEFARATDRQRAYQEQLSESIAAAEEEANRRTHSEAQEAITRANQIVEIDRQKRAAFEAAAAVGAFAAGQEDLARQTTIVNALFAQSTGILHAGIDEMHALAADTLAAAQALGVFDSFAEQLRPVDITVRGGDRATGVAANLEAVAGGMDAVLAVFGQIADLGQRGEQAGTIAEALIGKPGEWAMVDQLLIEGRISRTRYNETVEAGTHIAERRAEVERDLAVISARQLPILDAADAALARQIDKISHLSAEEQTAALGFLDANEAMQLQEAVALAAAAANTALGSSSRKAAEEIITAKAETDPVFAAMAEKIGLITRDRTGHIKVNFDNADTLQDHIDSLTESIDALTLALGGVPPTVGSEVKVTTTGGDEAKATTDEIAGHDGIIATLALVANATEAHATILEEKTEAEKPITIPVSFQLQQPPGASGDPRNIGGGSTATAAPTVPQIVTPPADTSQTVASLQLLASNAAILGANAGANAGTSFANALSSRQNAVAAAAGSLLAAMNGAFQSALNAARAWGDATGANYAVAFVNAIAAYNSAAFNAGFNLAYMANLGARAGMAAHSPSRAAIETAENYAGTFVDTLLSQVGAAHAAGFELAAAAARGAAAATPGNALRLARSVGFVDAGVAGAGARSAVVAGGGGGVSVTISAPLTATINGAGPDVARQLERVHAEWRHGIFEEFHRSAQRLGVMTGR